MRPLPSEATPRWNDISAAPRPLTDVDLCRAMGLAFALSNSPPEGLRDAPEWHEQCAAAFLNFVRKGR